LKRTRPTWCLAGDGQTGSTPDRQVSFEMT
jgi:hypothetical protein